jgi:peptide/nickel transport system permease protein
MVSDRLKKSLRRHLRSSALAKLGIALVASVLLVAVFAPLIAPYNPLQQNLGQSQLPPVGFSAVKNETTSTVVDGEIQVVTEQVKVEATMAHPLGTDALGRDMLSRVIYGARTSLLVGLFGTALAVLIGVSIGLSAGFYGDYVDDTLMRVSDIMLAFPSLVLAIALVGLFGGATVRIPDPIVVAGLAEGMPRNVTLPGTVILVVALVNWVWFARVSRGEALSVREEEYVKAARALGARDSSIVLRHVLPNSITPILVLATIQIATIILLESSLSYLGFSGTNLSWGLDIAQGRDYLATSWWIASIPGVAIVLTVIGLNLVGDWLRDALDPSIDGEGGV